MICPRCGETIDDIETICPFCLQDIDKGAEFNDFRKDGFVQIQHKNEADTAEPINYMPKYFNIAEFNIFVFAIIFVLVVSVMTVFSLRFVQKSVVENVPAYVVKKDVVTEPPHTEPETEKDVKNYTIKNIIGSWKNKGTAETKKTAIPYYSFTEDGTAQENYGSITSTGEYKDLSKGKKKVVYIDVNETFAGTFEFKFTSGKNGAYTLILQDISSGRVYEFVKAEAKAKKISPSSNFKTDKKLIGYWLNKKGDKSYEFNSDGTATRVVENTSTDCTWTVSSKGVITIKYMKNEVRSLNLDYIIKNDKLYINKTSYAKTEKEE